MRKIQNRIRGDGHEIIVDWTQHENIPDYFEEQNLAADYAEEDLSGAMECDVFVLLSNKNSRGSHLELGAAPASGKPDVYIIGELNTDSLFYFHEDVKRRDNINQVLNEL